MRQLYSLFIYIYTLFIKLAGLFSLKARKWSVGREKWEQDAALVDKGNDSLAWFHCASLGEFEQGRPVIQDFKNRFPEWKILITFFSPSGYEVRKNFSGADYIMYLPPDTPYNAKRFLELIKPDVAFFVKYEFWFNYLDELYKSDIKIIYFSSIFRPGQHFFAWYGVWFRKQLRKITWFFVQNTASADLLSSVDIDNVYISGDTRFDRVIEASQQAKEFPLLKTFSEGRRLVLAGSTWPRDEKLLSSLLNDLPDDVYMVIAPHNVDDLHINDLMNRFEGTAVKFSELNEDNARMFKVLVIDGMGFLIHLYRYAFIAYIGGGFGKSIHNILEAATFGKPVIFGPKYSKFKEAHDLLANGGAFTVGNFAELKSIIERLCGDSDFYSAASTECSDYVGDNRGATRTIMSKTEELIRMEIDY